MNSFTVGLTSAGCIFGAALLGLLLRRLLPQHHLRDDTKEVVKLGAAMIATLSALVLGLLVGSAKSSLDATNAAITQSGARLIYLDRTLADYGPEAQPIREQLRRTVTATIEMIWPEEKTGESGIKAFEHANGLQLVHVQLRALKPATDDQRQSFAQALQLLSELREARWLLIEQSTNEIPFAFLVVLLFWLSTLHLSFGLFAPNNTTVITVLLISALSVSGALFLVLEMNRPLDGIIKVSSAPMRKALEHLGE